jgi:hypothetical protein
MSKRVGLIKLVITLHHPLACLSAGFPSEEEISREAHCSPRGMAYTDESLVANRLSGVDAFMSNGGCTVRKVTHDPPTANNPNSSAC